MRILITGCSGLIGRWLVAALCQEDVKVFGIDKNVLPDGMSVDGSLKGNILDKSNLLRYIQKVQPDVIIHLAARCDLNGKTLEDYDTNITGVRNVCEAVRQTQSVKRVIYTSSQLVCEVGYVPKSDTDYCPHTIYGESKVRTEEIVRELDGGGCEWCIVRPTTVWGPHMGSHYQSLLRHIAKGTYFHSGRGELKKSYAYAGNIAYQYTKFIEASVHDIHREVFFLADYLPLSLTDYINQLAVEFGVRQPIIMPFVLAKLLALTGDVIGGIGLNVPFNSFRLRNIRTEYVFDMNKTKEVCGELPYTFMDGVKETAKWFMEENPSLFANNSK